MPASDEDSDNVISSQLNDDMLREIEKEAEQGKTNQATILRQQRGAHVLMHPTPE